MSLLLSGLAFAQQAVDVVPVTARSASRSVSLPGEFQAYLEVTLHAKVPGFVEKVLIDRGSQVKEGQLLATLVAPELAAQRAEAEAKVQSARSQEAEAQAKLVATESTYERLQAASKTPGAVAGNELVIAGKEVEAARSQVRAVASSVTAAEAAVAAVRDTEAYLRVTAPFSGVITERSVHPGALAGPQIPMFHLEQSSRLRLVIAVPESEVSGIAMGALVRFTVPAWPGEGFQGKVARAARSMDPKTRSMAVELDVPNVAGRLAPGMYPTVTWPVRAARPALLVPPAAVATTTERTFVIRVRDGVAEWVTVTKGPPVEGLLEVYGPLAAGDLVVARATDELREGTRLAPHVKKS